MGTTIEVLLLDQAEQLAELQKKLGYVFTNKESLLLSMIHSSFAFECLDNKQHNETLEFLGDAVLDLTIGHMLFTRFPKKREGQLTRIRSALVNEVGLATVARRLDLGNYLLLGRGEDSSGGREKSSILSCAYEALVGAMFMDSGYDTVLQYVQQTFSPMIEQQGEQLIHADAKSRLQEHLQELHNEGPLYVLDEEEGPAHARVFFVSARFRDQILGTGKAGSKKEAEQQAARAALALLLEEQEAQK
ncbi:MAG: ribonuclease III [Candidatus Electrothrix sp. GW3-4]|uniref:ribonuclease III n=1 Tax=Candidatus Electrothrix sp. GW3-4 TaxID=3126740 RepID=UPI0030D0487E